VADQEAELDEFGVRQLGCDPRPRGVTDDAVTVQLVGGHEQRPLAR